MNLSSYDRAFVGISHLENDEIKSNLERIEENIDSRR